MPAPIRHYVLRRSIRLGVDKIPPSLVIKVATTQEELEAAYGILYESFLEYGYQEPNPERLRIIKYFALPTSTTIVAKVEGRVVGTVTFIRKSPMGLPMEKAFDLSSQVKAGETLVEVSSLAIASEFRHQRGKIFFPICVYIYQYLHQYLSADYAAIAVNPAWADFYEGFLLFSKVQSKTVDVYNFANGAPAVGLISNVRDWAERFELIYGKLPRHKSFSRLLKQTDLSCFHWPDRQFHKAMDPVLTPEMIKYFFFEKSEVIRNLTESEYEVIRSFYTNTRYQLMLPPTSLLSRISPRFTVNLMARTSQAGQDQLLRVQDVSWEGLKVQGAKILGRYAELEITVAPHQAGQPARVAKIKGEVVWQESDSQSTGLKILYTNEVWFDYLNYLRKDLIKAA